MDDTLSAAALLDMAPDQQKNALGERLFARISTSQPEYAAKITGVQLNRGWILLVFLIYLYFFFQSQIEFLSQESARVCVRQSSGRVVQSHTLFAQ